MSIKRGDDNLYILGSNVSVTQPAVPIKGGEYTFLVEGSASGATVSLQVQSPNGNWATVQVFSGSAVSFTSLPGCQTGVDLPACNVRLAIGGGSPSGVSAWLVGLG